MIPVSIIERVTEVKSGGQSRIITTASTGKTVECVNVCVRV